MTLDEARKKQAELVDDLDRVVEVVSTQDDAARRHATATSEALKRLCLIAVKHLPMLSPAGRDRLTRSRDDMAIASAEDYSPDPRAHGCVWVKSTPTIPNPMHCDLLPGAERVPDGKGLEQVTGGLSTWTPRPRIS